MEVEVVYSVSFKCYKVFSLKMKKESPKSASHLKIIKILHMAKDTRKTLKRKKNEKRIRYKKRKV